MDSFLNKKNRSIILHCLNNKECNYYFQLWLKYWKREKNLCQNYWIIIFLYNGVFLYPKRMSTNSWIYFIYLKELNEQYCKIKRQRLIDTRIFDFKQSEHSNNIHFHLSLIFSVICSHEKNRHHLTTRIINSPSSPPFPKRAALIIIVHKVVYFRPFFYQYNILL